MARTAGSALSWAVLAALAVSVVARPVGCVDPPPTGTTGIDTTAVLQAVGPRVVVPTLMRFENDIQTLRDALNAWSYELDAGRDGVVELQAAQSAWADAMDTWQEAEVMQIGPAGASIDTVGGEDLRDSIYSWPTVNPCRVDQETVESAWDDIGFFDDNLVNSYGLDAIEHILWAGPENACPGQVPINSEGSWDALGDTGVARNRAAYASAMSRQIARMTTDLLEGWQGGFSMTDHFDSDQDALNAIFDALFYLETVTKDRKLGETIGLGDCTIDCADLAESLPSGMSTEWIAANLRGFRLLFTAGDAAGYDDLLRDADQASVADSVLAALDDADAAAAGFTGSIQEAAANEPERVQTLYDAVKGVTDVLKGDLATVLALEIPTEAAGDND